MEPRSDPPSRFGRFALTACAVLSVLGCDAQADGRTSYGDIQINTQLEAADGLDLKAVGELVKQVKDAEGLERQLNKEGGINNLDLNADGKVDFISVSEYGSDDTKGFSLTVEPEAKQVQEIATIEIEKKGDEAQVHLSGSEQIYGPHHHYQYGMPLASMLVMAYLFRPHPFYVSPFHFGVYPGYYGLGYAAVSPMRYETRTRALTRASSATRGPGRSSSLSPNHGKSASSGIRRSLRNPTASQRSFAKTSRRPQGASGFKSPPRTVKPTQRSLRPRRSFGSGLGRGGFRSRR